STAAGEAGPSRSRTPRNERTLSRVVPAMPTPTSPRSAAALLFALATLTFPLHLAAQAAPEVPTARAVRAEQAPRLDGRDDDEVWQRAPITDEFRQFTPGEAMPARFRTTIRVAYDDRMLYVFVRAYDPRPDSIMALLSRRDVRTQSDWIKVVVDGYR